jgi:hypothetical protein
MPVLQSFATWAQDNPKLITAVAAAFGVLAASVVVVNAAMALNPVVLITAGIVALGAALVMAYRKFDTFGMVVRTVVNGVATYFEFLANAYIKMINLVIKGINLIKPGKDIGTIGEVSFGRLGGSDDSVSTSVRAFEESQKMSSVPAGVDETNFDSVIAAAITSAKVKPTKAPTIDNTSGNAGGFANAGIGGIGPFSNLTINAGLISTPDQIGMDIIAAIQKAERRSGTVFAPA